MTDIVVYSNGNQESDRLEHLLNSENLRYLKYRLNEHFTERAFVQEFGEHAEYPQIAIGAKHLGGLKDFLRYLYSQDV